MTDLIAELGPLGLASRFRRLSDRMMLQCGEVYREHGFDFQVAWFPLVHLLWTRGPCSPSEATQVLGVTAASVSQVASELARRRLVSSRRDRGDGRCRVLDLTKKGKRLATELEPLWGRIQRSAEHLVSDTGLDLNVLALVEDAFDRGALRDGVAAAEPNTPEVAPTIRTARLVLRPFTVEDVDELQRLAADREVADQMISLPHPLRPANLRRWVRSHRLDHSRRSTFHFAVERRRGREQLIGAVELRDVDLEHLQAEISFWIGRPYWGRGFATEAAQAALHFAFKSIGVNRVFAHHMVRNAPSGRVLANAGMKREGRLRQRVRKNGSFEDVILCAALREEWLGSTPLVRKGRTT